MHYSHIILSLTSYFKKMTGVTRVWRFSLVVAWDVYATVLQRNYAEFRGNGISSIPIERSRIRGFGFLSGKPWRGTWQKRWLREWSVVKFASGWRSRLSSPEIARTKLRIRCHSAKSNDQPARHWPCRWNGRPVYIFMTILFIYFSLCLSEWSNCEKYLVAVSYIATMLEKKIFLTHWHEELYAKLLRYMNYINKIF